MLLFIKIIGIVCVVAVPSVICGAQVLLTNKQQASEKQKTEEEIKKTESTLNTAITNYQTQITRISTEKNALAETKEELTYKPVDIKTKIDDLKAAKTKYETHHTNLQQEITKAINAHNSELGNKKTEIEQLWTTEQSRISAINSGLDTTITNAKNTNKALIASIESLKDSINTTINTVLGP